MRRLADIAIAIFTFGLVHFALYSNDIAGYRGLVDRTGTAVLEREHGRSIVISSELHGIEGLLEPVTIPPGFYRYTRRGLSWMVSEDHAGMTVTTENCPYLALVFKEFERYDLTKPCTLWLTITNPNAVEWEIRFELEE